MGKSRLYPRYSHTQTGWVIIGALLAGACVVGASTYDSTLFPPWPIFAILGVIFIFFSTLTVTVDDLRVQAAFGMGLKMPAIELANVATAEHVENSFFNGWGIRFLPGGILYNVSGYQAVQLTTREGYVYRLGTDDPEGLLRAIQMRLEGMRA
ncbi:MAG: hypothetical protein OEZ32_11670 [Nitrospinota bacterium]|nr:hypothetical protein [Nitrospinota bacterium]